MEHVDTKIDDSHDISKLEIEKKKQKLKKSRVKLNH